MSRRVVTRLLAVLCLVAGAGSAAPALASTKPATTHLSLHSTAASYHVGAPIVLTGHALPATKATITLQRLVKTTWVTVAHAKPSTGGAFTFNLKASSKPVTWQLRAVRGGSPTVKAGASAAVKTPVVKAIYSITTGVAVIGSRVTVTGIVVPKASGSVLLQRLAGKTWVTLASAKLTSASTFTVTVTRPVGTTALRILRAATAAVAGRTGATLHATVAPPTTPTPPASPVLTVTSATLPEGTVGLAYSQQLTAANGTAPYTWSAAAGVLPAGLTLSSSGLLSGTTTSVSNTSFTVVVTDSVLKTAGAVVSVRFTLSPALVNTPAGWGTALFGSLPLPERTTTTAIGVAGINGITQLVADQTGAFALRFDGTVWAWGDNSGGEVTLPADRGSRPVPAQVAGLSHVTAIAGAGATGLALRSDGTVWAWGSNGYGQLGLDPTVTVTSAAAQVTGLTGIKAVAEGGESSFAVDSNGNVWAWGHNNTGQLGLGSLTDTFTPTKVAGLDNVAAMDATQLATVALKGDGTVWGWGDNLYGESSGDGLIFDQSPVQVPGMTGIASVAAGQFDTYAVATDGTVWAWGHNDHGQLGDGTTTGQGPVHLSLSGVVTVGGGVNIACAAMKDGTVRTWGWDYHSLLATTAVGDVLSPQARTVPGHVLSCDIGTYTAYALVSN